MDALHAVFKCQGRATLQILLDDIIVIVIITDLIKGSLSFSIRGEASFIFGFQFLTANLKHIYILRCS